MSWKSQQYDTDKEAARCLLFYTVVDFSSLRQRPPILGILNFTML